MSKILEAIDCKCGRKQCSDQMKVRAVRTEEGWTVMLHIARSHEWGSMGVRTCVLSAEDRARLIEALSNPKALWDSERGHE